MNLKLLFSLIAGVVIGAAGVQVSRALESPPAFLVVEYEITDLVGWQEYLARSRSIPSNRKFLYLGNHQSG